MAEQHDFQLLGVLHLPPLPSAPRARLAFDQVVEHALRDAEALVRGGIHRCVIENLGDAPFHATAVEPHVPAMLAVIGAEVRRRFGSDLDFGINVLRNDAESAMGAAAASGARFVRVNVLTGSAWTDQGLIHGQAARLLRYRRNLGASVRIMADVCVKHAVPAGDTDVVHAAVDTVGRGGADGVIVTGKGTGLPTDLVDVQRVVEAVPNHPVWVGSGVTPSSVAAFGRIAAGAIVGTYLHRDGRIELPIDEDRVASMVEAARS
jgi:membrane complex biogenesis BtpA family protein